jgi:uncharacterized protein (TIRG00374 family)
MSKHHRVLRPVSIGVALLIVALVVEYVVLPDLPGLKHTFHLLGTVNVGYLVLGFGLEVLSLLSYAFLTRAVLPPGAIHVTRAWRIDLSTLAVSHVIPGGTAAGTPLGYRLLTESNVSGADAGFAIGTQGIGSAIVLNAVFWVALVISIPFHPFNLLYGIAAGVGAVLLGIAALLVLAFTRGEEHAVRIVRAIATKLPKVDPAKVEATMRQLAARVSTLMKDPALLWRSVAWASANWLFDAASLWVFLLAFGKLLNPVDLLVAYGLANIMAVIPITPGGLGIIEGILIPTIAGFGTPKGIAILAVLGYRFVNFWLPIPVGFGTYLSLKIPADRARHQEELASSVEKGFPPGDSEGDGAANVNGYGRSIGSEALGQGEDLEGGRGYRGRHGQAP